MRDGGGPGGSTPGRPGRTVRLLRPVAIGLVAALLLPAFDLVAPPGRFTDPPLFVAVGLSSLFLLGGIYVWFWLRQWPSGGNAWPAAAGCAALAAVASLYPPLGFRFGVLLWLFPALVVGFGLRPGVAVPATFGLALGPLVVPLTRVIAGAEGPVGDAVGRVSGLIVTSAISDSVPVLVTGLGAVMLWDVIVIGQRLDESQAEVSRLAIEEERSRFARDLHDLLGHTLSLVVVKAELARKLLADPANPVATELDELQTLARSALSDVREAVAGYRQPTLASELAGVRVTLEAAGVAVTEQVDAGALHATVEGALAWTVREGATNIVRHAQAHRASFRIWRGATTVELEITDDGRGHGQVRASGSGLAGLRERVEALGGSFSAGRADSGGFGLRVSLPLDGPESENA
ncbi:MAG: sensor histidine kinase [Candidatus Dormibacteria bacterium]